MLHSCLIVMSIFSEHVIFHLDKYHVLTMGKPHNIKHAHNYRLGDTELEHVFDKKNLGVAIDSDLSFKDHIAEMIRKAHCWTFLDLF